MSFPYFILIIITCLNLGLAVLVCFRNPKSPTNASYGLIALAVSAWALTNAMFQATSNPHVAFNAAIASYVAAIFIVSSFCYFSFVFPKTERLSRKRRLMIVGSVPAIAGIVLIPNLVITGVAGTGLQKVIVTGSGIYLLAAYIVSLFTLSFVNLIRKYRTSSGRSKAQLKFVFLGTAISASFGVFFNLILPLLGNYRYVWLGPDFTVIMLAFIGYAIVKLRLMDIRLVIARSVTYALMITGFIAIYILTIMAINLYLLPSLSPNLTSMAVYASLAILNGLSFEPVKKSFNAFTERLFFKDRYDPEALVDAVSHALVSTVELPELLQRTLDIIIPDLRASRGAFVLLKERAVYAVPSKGFALSSLGDNDFKALAGDKVLVLNEVETYSEAAKTLRLIKATIAVPLSLQGQTIGLLLLGKKQGGAIYSQGDIHILELLAPFIALAIQNAQAYEKIKRLKVKSRTRKAARNKRQRPD